MGFAPGARYVPTGHVEGPALARPHTRVGFAWSTSKLRIAGLVLLATATPAAISFALSARFGQWLCLAWLAIIALLARGLSRRANFEAVVLVVDQRGIL